MGKTFSTGLLTNGIWQDASNNIGIGGSPSGSYKFEVTGASKMSGFLGVNGSPATSFPFEAYINSSTAYTSASRGNVMRMYNSNTGANVFAGIELGGAGTANDGLAGLNAVVTGSGSAALTFYTRNGGTFSEKMRITSQGYLSINQSRILGDTDICYIDLYNPLSGNLNIVNTSSNVNFGNIFLSTNSTERMRITSGGNIGIGDAGATNVRMILKSATNSSSDWALMVRSSTNDIMLLRNDGATFLSSFTYGNTVSDSPRTIYQGSGLGLGGISSVRASKKNIKNIDNIDWIYELNPVTFNYRKKDEEGNYTEETYEDLNYGLIAEDTAPIADFLINYNNKEDGSKQMVGIEYMRLITPLLKAIQELNAKVSALENK
jgi:hypothetical protein